MSDNTPTGPGDQGREPEEKVDSVADEQEQLRERKLYKADAADEATADGASVEDTGAAGGDDAPPPIQRSTAQAPKRRKKAPSDDERIAALEEEFTPEEQAAAVATRRRTAQAPVRKTDPTRTRAEATAATGEHDPWSTKSPVTFVKQSVNELRKVVWPTGREMSGYFAAVLVFVLFIITFVGLLDLLFGWALLGLLGD